MECWTPFIAHSFQETSAIQQKLGKVLHSRNITGACDMDNIGFVPFDSLSLSRFWYMVLRRILTTSTTGVHKYAHLNAGDEMRKMIQIYKESHKTTSKEV